MSEADRPVDESLSAPRSRQPLSNRADRQIGDLAASTVGLTNRDNVKLREECVFDGLAGTRAVPTEVAVDRFDSWYSESRKGKIVVENQYGERAGFNTPNRFTPEYREMLYAKAQSLERSLRDKWGRLLHTAMVTLTASTTDDQGRPRPLADHLTDLLESWEAVRRALSRTLDGREWEYLAILEPHKSGHAHVHLGVFVKGPVVAEQFQPVLDAHVRNCPTAGMEAHQVTDEDGDEFAVTVHRIADERNGSLEGLQNLGAYLAAYMAGEYGEEATAMPANVRAFYATVWATGKQWFRPSNGAQQFMQPDGEGDETAAEGEGPDWVGDEWEAVAFAPEGDVTDEDTLVSIDPESTGGVAYRRTRFEDWPGPD